MQRVFIILTVFFGTLVIQKAEAAKPVSAKQFINEKNWAFVENKGQLNDENGNSLNNIKFYGRSQGDPSGQGGVNIYCKPGMLAFVFSQVSNGDNQVSEATGSSSVDESSENTVILNRTELELIGANKNAAIIPEDEQSYYESYYTNHSVNDGIADIHSFQTIIYKDIYPNIDMVLHAKAQGMKYEFVVYPCGNVNDIRIKWNGLNNMNINSDGSISYAMASGGFEESSPVCFQGTNNIEGAFEKVSNNKGNYVSNIGFKVNTYDKSKILVIDPTLSWGTFFGGTNGTIASWSSAADDSGNVFISGVTTNTAGIATAGAFQTSFGGGPSDVFLAKFSNSGKLLWSTYFGSTGTDNGHGMAVDRFGNAYICGASTTKTGLATSGAYQTSNSSKCAFIAQFSKKGALNWSTYYGGGNEGLMVTTTDNSGNVFLCGTTTSTKGIASSGAYQTTFAGGAADLFLAKFSNSGAIRWSTYYGGSKAESPGNLATDAFGNIYLEGYSTSITGIASSGAYQTSMMGGATNGDAILAKFDSTGSRIWSTYYGGPSNDLANGIVVDAHNNVYITGNTSSTTGIATSGAFQTSILGGPSDAFVAKFSSAGHLTWGTYFGGPGLDQGDGLATDLDSNIYLTGVTASASGIATSGAFISSIPDATSLFVAKYNAGGTLLNGTYYPSNSSAAMFSISTFGYTNVFVEGNTSDTGGIATSGAYQTSRSVPQNPYLLKFEYGYNNDAGIVSVTNPVPSACADVNQLIFNLKNYGYHELDSVRVFWTLNGKLQTPFNWKGKLSSDSTVSVTIDSASFSLGVDTIKIWTSQPNGIKDSIPTNDTSLYITTINPLPMAFTGKNAQHCFGQGIDSLGTVAVVGNSYSWSSPVNGYSSTMSNPVVSSSVTTTYSLTETINATGCHKTDSVIITIHPLPKVNAGTGQDVCPGTTISLGNPGVSYLKYHWVSIPAGFVSDSAMPTAVNNDTTVYYLTETDSFGCNSTDSVIFNVKPVPSAYPGTNSSVCIGTSVNLGTASDIGSTYIWSSSPAGYSATTSSPKVTPDTTTTYYLTETNIYSCHKTDSVQIVVNPLPSPVAGKNGVSCSGYKVSLGSLPASGDKYNWTSSPSGFTSTISNPMVSPMVSTKYYLIDSNNFGCTKTDTVTISVKPLPDAHWNLNYIGDETNLKAVDSSFMDSSYHWAFGDGNAATGHDATHIFAKNKAFAISLILNDTNGCSNTFDSTVNIIISGIQTDISSNYSFGMYPNPFHNELTLDYSISGTEKVTVSLYDLNGRLIGVLEDAYHPAGKYSVQINTSEYNLRPGIYLLKLGTEKGSVVKQIEKY